jgi:hypothetical protein
MSQNIFTGIYWSMPTGLMEHRVFVVSAVQAAV